MIERSVPRQGYVVVAESAVIGEVTTGLYAPTVDRYVGMAYVLAAYASPGTEIAIVIRDKPRQARVVPRPFYTPPYRK
jgi:aminomethyltransferase